MSLDLVFVLLWGLVTMAVGVWASKAKPPRAILAKYPQKILFHISTPFSQTWRQIVEDEDLHAFERFRQRQNIFRAVFILPFLSFFAYLYVKHIVFAPPLP